WATAYLKDFTTFLTSGSRGWSEYFTDGGEMFLTIKNIKNCSISIDNVQYIHAPKTKEAERTKVQVRDLLISITADLGRTGVITADIADYGAYINQHISLVRLDQTKINPYFVSHFLETRAGKIQFESKNQVGVKAGLNFDAIGSLKILAPPLELQNRYVAFVEQADKSKFAACQQAGIASLLCAGIKRTNGGRENVL
ncbi:MAG: restriction endonuclease subunit S, partial [Deltaproteobacteria bacterium]|nr:restriction endonuclease subunit S [Deltaproteobacteria bacterium]